MAPSKKRSQPSAPAAEATRPSKKRKSAEAGMLKMKEIAEAEEAVSEDEVVYVKALKGAKTKTKEPEEDDTDVEEENTDVEDVGDLQAEEIAPPPVVAPGFRLWDTTSKLALRGELSQVAKVNLTSRVSFDRAADIFSLMRRSRSSHRCSMFSIQKRSRSSR